ncbi:MAG: class I SAM-dependent DNA methyltransferase [bacterium]
MINQDFTNQTKLLIDNLKGVCANYGLGNDGNEFKIITQVFLYKFMNDKFGYEIKNLDPKLKGSKNWEKMVSEYTDKEYEMLLMKMSPDSARLKREHYLSHLHNRQNQEQFAKFFDDTLRDIAIYNNDIFSVKTGTGAKIILFDEISQYITDSSKRDNFCRALINQLVNFSFEQIFEQKFDFFATIFEYLIKDYNKDGGGKYAEYYTPHAVAKIMASILVGDPVKDVTCYDPSAGSGTLLMSLAHAIGEDKCTIYSQDISQKSSGMLRLNLILNNLVHSIQNIIQDNTLTNPYHRINNKLMKFDYIVSNPPFKLDFSDFRNDLDTKENLERFFAGIPNIPKKSFDKMPIYLLFIQHIMFSLSDKGKAAVVVPTGFLTAQSGIELKIRQKLIVEKMLRGVVSMPSNIFASTGTNVSVLFIDKENTTGKVILMDASKLGTTIKDGKNQKTLLSVNEEQQIIDSFNKLETKDDFSVVVPFENFINKNYAFSAGQYFDIKIEITNITEDDFNKKIQLSKENLKLLFNQSSTIEKEIENQLDKLIYERKDN